MLTMYEELEVRRAIKKIDTEIASTNYRQVVVELPRVTVQIVDALQRHYIGTWRIFTSVMWPNSVILDYYMCPTLTYYRYVSTN